MGKNRDIAVRRQGVEVAMRNSHCFNIYMNRLSACLTQIIPLIARTGTRHLCVEVQDLGPDVPFLSAETRLSHHGKCL
jgi:hypothetical protein